MPRLRLGSSPLTLGLAGGIPSATAGILDVLKLREAQRRNEITEAYQQRLLALQEQAAARTAQEFTRQQGLRGALGQNLATTQGVLAGLQPTMMPGIPFGGATLGEPGFIGEETFTAPRPPSFERPSPFAAFQTPEAATAFGQVMEVSPEIGRGLVQTAADRLKEAEARQRVTAANQLMDEARKIGGRDPVGATGLMVQAANIHGLPISQKDVWDAVAKDPETAKQDLATLWPIFDRMLNGDRTAVGDLFVGAATAKSVVGSLFADQAKTSLAGLPGVSWLGAFHDAVRQEQTQTGKPVSDERLAEIAEGLAQGPGGQQGFRAAYAASKLFKDRYDLGKKIKEEKATGAFQLRAAQTKLAEERTQQVGREKPAEKKERTAEEANAALVAFSGGDGEYSNQELLNLATQARRPVSVKDQPVWLRRIRSEHEQAASQKDPAKRAEYLTRRRAEMQRQGMSAKEIEAKLLKEFPEPISPAPVAPSPATAPQGFEALPPPAKYSGRTVTDTATGKRYRSDGTRWVEVK